MNLWKYYDISHKGLLICNPMNRSKFETLCKLFRLLQNSSVLDIACGKGEVLIRLAELYEIQGIGVDISPYCIKKCLEKKRQRVPKADLTFIELDGIQYKPASFNSFNLTLCLGATFVYGGYKATLHALKIMTKSEGLVVVGEPFWLKEPDEEYLKAEQLQREEFKSHPENVKIGEDEGLHCLYTMVSNHDDWDHYETSQWWAVDNYVRSHPNDPDNTEILERTRRAKETYLRWGRDTLGWAIYVFRNDNEH